MPQAVKWDLFLYANDARLICQHKDIISTQSKVNVMLTFEKTQKYCFLNRMKYIEGSLMKSSGKISREH